MSRYPRYLTSEDLLDREQHNLTEARLQRIREVVANRQRGLMVLMEDVYNPHNLAAIARSCDAFGVQQVAFTVENNALFDPKEIGRISSSSASKWLDYRTFLDGARRCIETLHDEGWHVMATLVSSKAKAIYDIDFTLPQYERLVVMVGNERDGLSLAAAEAADSHMVIPMQGMIRSFNVSVATAVTLAEITRQRRASDRSYALPPDEARALTASLVKRSRERRRPQ